MACQIARAGSASGYTHSQPTHINTISQWKPTLHMQYIGITHITRQLNCVGDKKTLPRELSGFSLSAMKKKENFEAFSRLECYETSHS